MEAFLTEGRKFRALNPTPGSPEAIEALSRLIEEFDKLGSVTLPADPKHRQRLAKLLYLFPFIKEDFLNNDWEKLYRKPILYGLQSLDG